MKVITTILTAARIITRVWLASADAGNTECMSLLTEVLNITLDVFGIVRNFTFIPPALQP